MPPNLAAYEITKDNFLEAARNILYTFVEYYAHTATVIADGIAAWGSWVTVSAKATEKPASPSDLKDKCRLTLDRIIPLGPDLGNYPVTGTGEDHVVARRCSALFTLQTHRESHYRLEELYAKFADLFDNRRSQLATKDMRHFIITQMYAPVQANENQDIAVRGVIVEFEVTYVVKVVRT